MTRTGTTSEPVSTNCMDNKIKPLTDIIPVRTKLIYE